MGILNGTRDDSRETVRAEDLGEEDQWWGGAAIRKDPGAR